MLEIPFRLVQRRLESLNLLVLVRAPVSLVCETKDAQAIGQEIRNLGEYASYRVGAAHCADALVRVASSAAAVDDEEDGKTKRTALWPWRGTSEVHMSRERDANDAMQACRLGWSRYVGAARGFRLNDVSWWLVSSGGADGNDEMLVGMTHPYPVAPVAFQVSQS